MKRKTKDGFAGYKPFGFGYISSYNGKACMIRCFFCGDENYAPNVSSGFCSICGRDSADDPTILAEMKLLVSETNKDGSMRRNIQ